MCPDGLGLPAEAASITEKRDHGGITFHRGWKPGRSGRFVAPPERPGKCAKSANPVPPRARRIGVMTFPRKLCCETRHSLGRELKVICRACFPQNLFVPETELVSGTRSMPRLNPKPLGTRQIGCLFCRPHCEWSAHTECDIERAAMFDGIRRRNAVWKKADYTRSTELRRNITGAQHKGASRGRRRARRSASWR